MHGLREVLEMMPGPWPGDSADKRQSDLRLVLGTRKGQPCLYKFTEYDIKYHLKLRDGVAILDPTDEQCELAGLT